MKAIVTMLTCIAMSVFGGFLWMGSANKAEASPPPELKLCMLQQPIKDSINPNQTNEVLHKLVCDSLQKYRSTLKTKYVYRTRIKYRTKYITNTYLFIAHFKEPVSDPDTVSYNLDKTVPERYCSESE